MVLVDSLIVFAVGLAIGALGIHVGAIAVLGKSDYSGAVLTALVGALAWAFVSFFFGWIPFLGPALTYLAWLAAINARYEGGWITAAFIAFIAWITAVLILYLLASVGIGAFDAIGIPQA